MTPQNMVLALLSQDSMTEKSLAELAGSNQPSIHRIKKGAGCSYDLGKRLEVLCVSRGLYQNITPDLAA